MTVAARRSRYESRPIHAAQMRRRRFPWYFEMDSATLFMAGVTLLALTCLLYLLQTSRVAVLGYQIQRVQMQQVEAERATNELQYEIHGKESLTEVEDYARTKLNMKPVDGSHYIRVRVTPKELRALEAAQEEGRTR